MLLLACLLFSLRRSCLVPSRSLDWSTSKAVIWRVSESEGVEKERIPLVTAAARVASFDSRVRAAPTDELPRIPLESRRREDEGSSTPPRRATGGCHSRSRSRRRLLPRNFGDFVGYSAPPKDGPRGRAPGGSAQRCNDWDQSILCPVHNNSNASSTPFCFCAAPSVFAEGLGAVATGRSRTGRLGLRRSEALQCVLGGTPVRTYRHSIAMCTLVPSRLHHSVARTFELRVSGVSVLAPN